MAVSSGAGHGKLYRWRCHGERGSQKYTFAPVAFSTCCQRAIAAVTRGGGALADGPEIA